MKTYVVLFDPLAQEEALEAAEYIARFSPVNAAKWFAGLEKLIASLRMMPGRCAKARESETLRTDLRQYIYHSHRVIFRIEEETRTVRILHIRHSARAGRLVNPKNKLANEIGMQPTIAQEC